MEDGFKSWFLTQQIDPNLSSAQIGLQHRLNIPSLGNTLSPNSIYENRPMFTFVASKPQEPCGWFYGLTPVVNSIPKQQLPEANCPQKKYLVFDQSNDLTTTLIYSSTPNQYQHHLPKPKPTFDIKKERLEIEKHEDTHFPNLNLDYGNIEVSEMHEDTEELEALLYSDSDDDEIDDYEDEDEQSTGHSPVLMNGFDRHEYGNENFEEVASSTSCKKRCKRDYDYEDEDEQSSGKSGVNSSHVGEFSSCGNDSLGIGNGFPDVESGCFPIGKRARKEKVKETINVLENLIPGGKSGKDAMVILDEAISYLRILKVEAKALGLDSL